MVYNWLKIARQAVFPGYCELCRGKAPAPVPLCDGCRQELPWLPPACPTCATPLPKGRPHCPRCLAHAPLLDACQALFDYAAPVDGWIRALKFHGRLSLATLLGRMLAARMPVGNGATVIPVPLHPGRLRQRGFNQALEIARPLQARGYRIDNRCCVRSRATGAQSRLTAATRRENMADAFEVRRDVHGERLILVDDVVTTGATLDALARVLRCAGAQRVEAWVVARTPPPRRAQRGSGQGVDR